MSSFDPLIKYVSFLMASAGAAAIMKVIITRTDFLCDTWLNNKPFSCPLCMGFWFGLFFSIFEYGIDDGLFFLIYRSFQAAAFSWFFYWKVTGDE